MGVANLAAASKRLNIRALPRRRAPVDQWRFDPIEECPVRIRHMQSRATRLAAAYPADAPRV